MRIAICFCIAATAIVTSAPCEAGGFFRRVPEVGEWARYDHAASFTSNIGSPVQHTAGFNGTLLVKCVGEEIVDDRRHLWIECHVEIVDANLLKSWTVSKVLVAEEELLADSLSGENVRGWRRSISQDEAAELTDAELDELSFFLGPDPDEPTERTEERTIVVNDVEVALTSSETGPMPPREIGNGDVLNSDVTYWPAEELAFGIASIHHIFRGGPPRAAINMHGFLTYDLVATGTDAVSELPENN